MTYTNGLGNLQNLPGTGATADTRRSEGTTNTSISAGTSESVMRGTDQTQFSSASGLLGEALSGQDARMPKVLALSAAIASGTYSVSASDVSGTLIDSMLN